MTTDIFSFIVVIGILIFFHELGHFLMARLFGVRVETFSLGFGPRLIGKTLGGTEYRISAVPLGGYVKMAGEDLDAEIDPEDEPYSFAHQHVAKRMMIVAAGPLFNLLLALVLIVVVYWASGVYVLKPTVGTVEAGTPAQRQGLKPGDEITAIDGAKVDSWNAMSQIIGRSEGRELTLSIRRGSKPMTIHVRAELTSTPNLFGQKVRRYLIGIGPSDDSSYHVSFGLVGALKEGAGKTYYIAKLIVLSIAKMIGGRISSHSLGGPILIAQMAGKQAKEGAANFFFFIALMSVNLGIINLFPIPVLDGGHLLFFGIEAIMGRPVNMRVREISQQIGIVLLLFLIIYVFYNDINRLIVS
jgi:regulator of sigma E protease